MLHHFFTTTVCASALLLCGSLSADWTVPTKGLPAFGTTDAQFNSLSMNASGMTAMIWDAQTGSGYDVIASIYDGINWNSQVVASSATQLSLPAIALNDAGNGFAIWYDNTDSLKASYFNGTSFSPAVTIGSDGDTAYAPQIAIDNAGHAVAIWVSESTSLVDSNIFNGTGWTGAVAISTEPTSSNNISLAMNRSGIAFASWVQNSGNNVTHAALFNGTSWGTPVVLSSPASDSYSPAIAINSSGLAAAAWVTNAQTFSSLFNGLGWGSATMLSQTGSGWGEVEKPAVTINASGDAIVVWQQLSPVEQWQILGRSWNGTAWSTDLLGIYNTFSGTLGGFGLSDQYLSAYLPEVSLNDLGDAIVCWETEYQAHTHNQTHSINVVTLQSGTWSYATPISLGASGEASINAHNSQLGFNNAGQVVVGWQFYNGTTTVAQASTNQLSSLFPPSSASGSQHIHRVPFQVQRVNKINWEPTPEQTEVSYRIYRNGILLVTVSAGTLAYQDTAINVGQTYNYGVRAVQANGYETADAPGVIINP